MAQERVELYQVVFVGLTVDVSVQLLKQVPMITKHPVEEPRSCTSTCVTGDHHAHMKTVAKLFMDVPR
eukprot:13471335-Alexandrium_andersonii.AAC.1